MIKSIKTTFDFGKLVKKMPEILNHYGNIGAKALAEDARNMIKGGKLKNVTKGTMEIARKNLYKPGGLKRSVYNKYPELRKAQYGDFRTGLSAESTLLATLKTSSVVALRVIAATSPPIVPSKVP